MKHDQLWKEVLLTFLREFLELFFPVVAECIDFNGIVPLDKEVFTDTPDGELREPDLVVQVRTKDGDTEFILIHVEVQAERRSDMPFRMWEYYSLLRMRKKAPVFPVVLYLAPGAGGITEEEYAERLFGMEIILFRYSAISLPDLPAEPYLELDNALAPALSSLMRSEGVDRVTRKLKAYERLSRAHLDEARGTMLMNVVDQYLVLNTLEQLELEQRIGRSEPEEVREMLTQWHERGRSLGRQEGIQEGIQAGIQAGIQKGIQEGIQAGKQETLLRLMRRKFGELPEGAVKTIRQITAGDSLDELADRVLDAKSLDDMRLDEILQ